MVKTPPGSPCDGFSARRLPLARHFLLAEDRSAPGLVRFLSLPIELAEGTKSTWITVTRTGTFSDPRYGQFDITHGMLAQMVQNFDARVLGQEVFIDVAHKPNDGAAARVVKLAVEGNKLRALVEWTAFGIDAVRSRGFAYLSAEFCENWKDNEQGQPHGCVLLGAGLTTRPVIKHLDRVALSAADSDDEDAHRVAIHPALLKSLEQNHMDKYLEMLRAKLLAQGLNDAAVVGLLAQAKKLLEQTATDEAKCLATVASFEAAGAAAAEQIKTLSAAGNTGGAAHTVNVTAGLSAADVAAEVTRVLAQRTQDEAAAATTMAGKFKLLSEALTASKALSVERQAEVEAALKPLVKADSTEADVKALADYALATEERGTAAAKMALLGYRAPSGNVHISVDSGNAVKALQQQVDRRLGFEGMPDAERYKRTGGQLLPGNKAFADKCLAEFDAENGARLNVEHKALAGGTSVIADTKVPSVVERTVLREMLYGLQGLSFVNVGTAGMASVLEIPYSYRDITAAGIGDTRTYELQAIKRANMLQTTEEARPIPQKLADKISNEVRYLLAAAPIDYDPLAESIRNIVRVIGEDTDRLVQNEVLNATDEALTATGSDTLTAQVNGTNRIFVLSNFPVVRPRAVFDLKGVQVGTTVNPITVTLGGTPITEYRAGQANGNYWVLDYNLGELRIVNQAGVLQTPAGATALVVNPYTYTLNVAKANIDIVGGDKIGDVYDRILTQIGGRKVVVENDRYYTADMLLMSGAIDNALGQALTFSANSSRPGTGLSADGSVGIIKGITAFNTRAPGLNTGDSRIIVGQRGNTRFRMMRAFQMKEASQARDANGFFIGAEENYGEQFVVCMTPAQLKNSNTSLVMYSATARVARAA